MVGRRALRMALLRGRVGVVAGHYGEQMLVAGDGVSVFDDRWRPASAR
jgi:hypothetical protein